MRIPARYCLTLCFVRSIHGFITPFSLVQLDVAKVQLEVDTAGPDERRVQLLRVVGGHHHDAVWAVHHAVQHVEQTGQVQLVLGVLRRASRGPGRRRLLALLLVLLLLAFPLLLSGRFVAVLRLLVTRGRRLWDALLWSARHSQVRATE